MKTLTLKQQKQAGCEMQNRDRCHTCRTDADWRERAMGIREFACPHNYTATRLPSDGWCWSIISNIPTRPGDVVYAITSVTGLRWLRKRIELKTGNPCNCDKRRKDMNRAGWRGLPKYIWRQFRKT